VTRCLLLSALLTWQTAGSGAGVVTREFTAFEGVETYLTLLAGCAQCDWGADKREAAVLRVSVDGVYSQHVVLARGETPAEYRLLLTGLISGPHQLSIERDTELSAPDAGPAGVEIKMVGPMFPRPAGYLADLMSPILYARANTIGRFTDLPLVMWYEVVPTSRGKQYRYSVIFTNEDGGTPTDRLMATWGRTTDIEFVYGVEIDALGNILAEEFQGPGHEVPRFNGQHEGRHPLLWVSTDNNMVSDSGTTAVRYALRPEPFDLAAANASREAVMDANPWVYTLMGQELAREHKIVDGAPPGQGTISDPRRFVYVEACAEVGNAALALEIGVRRSDRASARDDDGSLEWIASDRGLRQYRIVRDGCVRIATPLPGGVTARDIRALRVRAFERPPAEGAARVEPTLVRLRRVNKMFLLDDQFQPQASLLAWQGTATIATGGAPFELPIR